MRILIAEDDLVSRTFLSGFLRKYGDCDLVVDGIEALDAFLLAMKDRAPYDLICLDIMMPKADGVSALKGIRDIERQYGVTAERRAKVIMTTALAELGAVQAAFRCGCEAYATKPIDTAALGELIVKLGLTDAPPADETGPTPPATEDFDEKIDFPANYGMGAPGLSGATVREGYFKSVHALPDYQLEVYMETDSTIHFDFRSRLDTARFGRLKDEELFRNVRTDGDYLIFEKAGKMPVKITASEFMDLVLIDRRK
jgi:two-component system chemotaxis response regulator CheY